MEHIHSAYANLADAGQHSAAMAADRASMAMAAGVSNFAQELSIAHQLDLSAANAAVAMGTPTQQRTM